jgi:hypothetical protein
MRMSNKMTDEIDKIRRNLTELEFRAMECESPQEEQAITKDLQFLSTYAQMTTARHVNPS